MKRMIPCRVNDNLDWEPILKSAGECQNITWEFDLGLDAPYFPIEDELTFSGLKFALSRFSKEVWPLYEERTSGAVLYRGAADFSSHFRWSENQEENWKTWKEGRPEASEAHLRRLFCADAFAHYFQMLAHALPDELPLTLHFDTSGCGTPAEKRQLLSKERFEHFHIVTEESAASLAVLMPPEELCSGSVLSKIDRLLMSLDEPYRVIEEAFLTESWDGVDQIYVISEAVSFQGKRKLMGFCAAGGLVLVEGASLGLPNEAPAEKFRGRGI